MEKNKEELPIRNPIGCPECNKPMMIRTAIPIKGTDNIMLVFQCRFCGKWAVVMG
jgi:transcription elongation factor Elf1